MRLMPRDRLLLADVFLQRYMTAGQILGLGCYFHSLSRLNERLRALFDHGLLLRHLLPLAHDGGPVIYSAAPAAAPIIAGEIGWDVAQVRRLIRHGSPPTTLQHCLRVTDIRIAFQKAGRSAGIRMEWRPELLCRHRYRYRADGKADWSETAFKPDGYLRLQGGSGAARHLFLECDLDNVSEGRIAVKLSEAYRRYLELGLFARRYGGDGFGILFVTTHTARRDRLVRLAEQAGAKNALVTTFAELEAGGALGTIWHVPGGHSPASLL